MTVDLSTDIAFRTDVTVLPIQQMGGDAAVVAAARVSTAGTESLEALEIDPSEASGLIRFLMRNRHGTPFEHNSMTFLIEAPIFVFREFHRHRIGWSYNEESGRYKQLAPTFYIPARDRNLMQIGKPGAYEFVPGDDELYGLTYTLLRESCLFAYLRYERMLEEGVAKEVARMLLPVNTFSSMYATCNARSLMAFLSLRTKHELAKVPSFPQREIEMVAEQLEAGFAQQMPITYQAFNDFGRVAP